MHPLAPGEEVMLLNSGRVTFNPYYGLVVLDPLADPLGIQDRSVWVLWEDGEERMHFRSSLLTLVEMKKAAGALESGGK